MRDGRGRPASGGVSARVPRRDGEPPRQGVCETARCVLFGRERRSGAPGAGRTAQQKRQLFFKRISFGPSASLAQYPLTSIWVNGAKVYRPGNHCYAGPKGRLRREERVFKTMRGTVAVFGRETNAALFAHDCATLDLP